MTPTLSVFIVNWNSRDDLRRCLASIRETVTFPHETIVVDNASRDGSGEMVKRDFPDVQLVANERNVGYAAANNRAYGLSAGEFVLLLNPDVTLAPRSVERLVGFLNEHVGVAAVCPVLKNTDGSIQREYNRRHVTLLRLIASTLHTYGVWRDNPIARDYLMLDDRVDEPQPIEHAAAACLLLRRTALESIGGLFDERFPIFLNDVDLSLRLTQAKQAVWILPSASATHRKSQSTDRLDPYVNRELYFRSILTLFRIHRRWWSYFASRAILILVLPTVLLGTAIGLNRRYFLSPITDRRASLRKQLRIIRSVLFEGPLPQLP